MELDDNTKKHIEHWAKFVTMLLDIRLAKDKFSLEDWVSSSFQEGDIQFQEQQLTNLCNLRVSLPPYSIALHQRLNTARVAHKTVEAIYNTVFAFFKSLESAVIAQL